MTEMRRLDVRSALVLASQAIDEHPVWSPNGDALAVNVDGRWMKVALRPLTLENGSWHDGQPIGVVKSPAKMSSISESDVRKWEKSSRSGEGRVTARRHGGRAAPEGPPDGVRDYEEGVEARDPVDERPRELPRSRALARRALRRVRLRAQWCDRDRPVNHTSSPGRRRGLAPYLLIGLGWFLFLVFASRVRTIEPVFLWVLTQGLILEKVFSSPVAKWVSLGVLLAAYMIAGLVAWALVERPGRDPSRIWRRAFLAWLGVQLIYCLVATALVQFGVLSE